jgi:hypothetical protein
MFRTIRRHNPHSRGIYWPQLLVLAAVTFILVYALWAFETLRVHANPATTIVNAGNPVRIIRTEVDVQGHNKGEIPGEAISSEAHNPASADEAHNPDPGQQDTENDIKKDVGEPLNAETLSAIDGRGAIGLGQAIGGVEGGKQQKAEDAETTPAPETPAPTPQPTVASTRSPASDLAPQPTAAPAAASSAGSSSAAVVNNAGKDDPGGSDAQADNKGDDAQPDVAAEDGANGTDSDGNGADDQGGESDGDEDVIIELVAVKEVPADDSGLDGKEIVKQEEQGLDSVDNTDAVAMGTSKPMDTAKAVPASQTSAPTAAPRQAQQQEKEQQSGQQSGGSDKGAKPRMLPASGEGMGRSSGAQSTFTSGGTLYSWGLKEWRLARNTGASMELHVACTCAACLNPGCKPAHNSTCVGKTTGPA